MMAAYVSALGWSSFRSPSVSIGRGGGVVLLVPTPPAADAVAWLTWPSALGLGSALWSWLILQGLPKDGNEHWEKL